MEPSTDCAPQAEAIAAPFAPTDFTRLAHEGDPRRAFRMAPLATAYPARRMGQRLTAEGLAACVAAFDNPAQR